MIIVPSVIPAASSKPFLPNNFYEVSKGGPFTATVFAGDKILAATAPQVPLGLVKPRARRYVRTITTLFHDDRRMSHANINLTTGELLPWNYKGYSKKERRYRSQPSTTELGPFWVHMPAAQTVREAGTKRDTSRCKRTNPIKMYLDGYLCLSEAAENLPQLRDAIESAKLLDLGGNTRPLASGRLFGMLQQLEVITPGSVKEFMRCSLRHAQKVALCLRVIANAFEKCADGKLSTATYKTPPKKEPCVSEAGKTDASEID
jgi:hypothetical protein